jgi:RND family efflux transporter MFP subunit
MHILSSIKKFKSAIVMAALAAIAGVYYLYSTTANSAPIPAPNAISKGQGVIKPPVFATATAPKPVETKTAEPKSDALGCLVEPFVVVDVSSPSSGRIDQVAVERGDTVVKGQTLATLESRVERASVALAIGRLNNTAEVRSAETNVEFSRKKHERNESLHRDGVVSAQVREQAESDALLATERLKQTREQRSVAAQEVQLAQAQLAMKVVSSPISGLVIEKYLSAGERTDDKPIVKIAQIDPLRVEAILPASMYGKVKKGMSAKVQPELSGMLARQASVVLVDRVIDPASNTFRVRLELPNSDSALPSGVRCKVNINPA